MYVLGIAINRAEARRKVATRQEQDGSRQDELLLWINTASGHWSSFYVAQS